MMPSAQGDRGPVARRLHDGHTVLIRPISASDGEGLRRFHDGLSERTVYQRFFAPHPHLSDEDVDLFTHVDHEGREALVAVAGGRIVGVGRFDALASHPGQAEVAFVVTDDYQGQGIGRLLFSELLAVARARGIGTFVAEVLPANGRMMQLFRDSGHPVTQEQGEGVVILRLALSDDGGGPG